LALREETIAHAFNLGLELINADAEEVKMTEAVAVLTSRQEDCDSYVKICPVDAYGLKDALSTYILVYMCLKASELSDDLREIKVRTLFFSSSTSLNVSPAFV
jgi:hypothetical protein